MMQQIRTDNPPVWRERDGKWYVVLSTGSIEIEAEVSVYAMERFLELIIVPTMQRAARATERKVKR